MIANNDKLQVIVLDKRKSNVTEVTFIIGSGEIQAVSFFDILGVKIDDKLNFDLYIDKICLKSANQLNALFKLNRQFLQISFKFLPSALDVSNVKSVYKIEAIQKRTLRFILNDHGSLYEDLLKRSRKQSMGLKRTRILRIEIYKTVDNLNQQFMKNLLKLVEHRDNTN